MEGRDWAKRQRAAVAEEEKEKEVENKRRSDISGDGGEDEGPGIPPGLAMAPSEPNDRRMLRQVIDKALKHHHHHHHHGRQCSRR